MNENKFLSRKEVAKMLGISLVTLHNHQKKGILRPSHKIGRKPYMQTTDIVYHFGRDKVSIARRMKVNHLGRMKVSHP